MTHMFGREIDLNSTRMQGDMQRRGKDCAGAFSLFSKRLRHSYKFALRNVARDTLISRRLSKMTFPLVEMLSL